MLRVLVAQEHRLLASEISTLLETKAHLTVCGVVRTAADAAVAALRETAALVVMDFHLADVSGPAAAVRIRAATPEVAIVFHSAEDSDAALLDAIDAGATAYLTRSATAAQLLVAVTRASNGEVLIPVSLFAKSIARQRSVVAKQRNRARLAEQFTARELDMLNRLAEGLDTTAMAQRLGIAVHTVEWHVRHVIEKLGVHSKLQSVIAAARSELIEVAKP